MTTEPSRAEPEDVKWLRKQKTSAHDCFAAHNARIDRLIADLEGRG